MRTPANDAFNLKVIDVGLCMYREAHGAFPDRLSQLQEHFPNTSMFVSPLRPEKGTPWYRRWVTWRSHPEPGKVVLSWSEVDCGDYLYRKPPTNAPPGTILAMTRPGLSYRNAIMVLPVEGGIVQLEAADWKHRADIAGFLKETGIRQQ